MCFFVSSNIQYKYVLVCVIVIILTTGKRYTIINYGLAGWVQFKYISIEINIFSKFVRVNLSVDHSITRTRSIRTIRTVLVTRISYS